MPIIGDARRLGVVPKSHLDHPVKSHTSFTKKLHVTPDGFHELCRNFRIGCCF
jgi:hypothetical protein